MNAQIERIRSCLIAAAAIACGGQNDAVSRSRSAATDTAAASASDHVQSATGHIEFVGINGGDNWYSFGAIKTTNRQTGEETVSGEVQYHSLQADGTFEDVHGTVICLGIQGNVARIGAVGDIARNVPNPGPGWGYFTVIDNGEGADDPADRGSNVFGATEQSARDFCNFAFNPTLRIFDTLVGNVQVRN